jgi:hypothetical protein
MPIRQPRRLTDIENSAAAGRTIGPPREAGGLVQTLGAIATAVSTGGLGPVVGHCLLEGLERGGRLAIRCSPLAARPRRRRRPRSASANPKRLAGTRSFGRRRSAGPWPPASRRSRSWRRLGQKRNATFGSPQARSERRVQFARANYPHRRSVHTLKPAKIL